MSKFTPIAGQANSEIMTAIFPDQYTQSNIMLVPFFRIPERFSRHQARSPLVATSFILT